MKHLNIDFLKLIKIFIFCNITYSSNIFLLSQRFHNKEIFDLNDLEVFLILKILLDLDLQEAFKSLSIEFLLYRT